MENNITRGGRFFNITYRKYTSREFIVNSEYYFLRRRFWNVIRLGKLTLIKSWSNIVALSSSEVARSQSFLGLKLNNVLLAYARSIIGSFNNGYMLVSQLQVHFIIAKNRWRLALLGRIIIQKHVSVGM